MALAQFCTATVIVKGGVGWEQDSVDVTLPTSLAGGQASPVCVLVPANVLVIFPRTVIPAITLTLTVVFDTALGVGELLPAFVCCTVVCTLSGAACNSKKASIHKNEHFSLGKNLTILYRLA